jgi:Leucine-rich repeat (LRR) protein
LNIPKGVDGKKVTSLSGVEKLKHLEILNTYNHEISDLTPLSKLKKLRGWI